MSSAPWRKTWRGSGRQPRICGGIGEREDEPTDPAERSALIEQAEEQEALIDVLEARRQELLQELGRPGTGTGSAG